MSELPPTHPLSWSLLVDYWAADADLTPQVLDAVEEHLMGCESCSLSSARVAALTEALRTLVPPLLKPQTVAQLAARGLQIVDNPMQPGERREVWFPRHADILLHRLRGLPLERATRVSFVLRVEGSGDVLVSIDDAPFDRERGEVLVACQQHYASLPPDTVAEIRVRDADDRERVAMYTILHRFEAAT